MDNNANLVELAPGTGEASLREQAIREEALASRTVLKVNLNDAKALLGCVEYKAASQRLLELLFRVRWCWRPEEMTEKRINKTTGEEIDVCVWGLVVPTAPPQCTESALKLK